MITVLKFIGEVVALSILFEIIANKFRPNDYVKYKQPKKFTMKDFEENIKNMKK